MGQYLVALGIAVFLAQISTLGASKLIIKKIAASNAMTLSSSYLMMSMMLVSLGCSISYFAYSVLVGAFQLPQILPIYGLFSMSLYFVFVAVFYGEGASGLAVFFQYIIQPFVFLCLSLYGFTSFTLIELFAISSAFCSMLAFLYLVKKGYRLRTALPKGSLKQFVEECSTYFGVMFAGLVATHLLLPLGAIWLSDESVALTGIIVRVCNVLFFTVTSVRLLLLPRMVKSYAKRDRKQLKELCQLGMTFPLLVWTLSVTFIIFFGGQILTVFGEQYSHGHNALIFGVFALLPAFAFGWCENLLIAQNIENKVLLASFASMIFSFVGVIVFTNQYQIVGFLAFILGAKSVYAILTWIFSRRLQQ